jgi:hypothetical protein
MAADDRDWTLAMYEQAVVNPHVRSLALEIAQNSNDQQGDITLADLDGARRYLRACYLRMSTTEVSALTVVSIASLWARGTVGAFKYRTAGGGGATGAKKPARRSLQSRKARVESDDGDAST